MLRFDSIRRIGDKVEEANNSFSLSPSIEYLSPTRSPHGSVPVSPVRAEADNPLHVPGLPRFHVPGENNDFTANSQENSRSSKRGEPPLCQLPLHPFSRFIPRPRHCAFAKRYRHGVPPTKLHPMARRALLEKELMNYRGEGCAQFSFCGSLWPLPAPDWIQHQNRLDTCHDPDEPMNENCFIDSLCDVENGAPLDIEDPTMATMRLQSTHRMLRVALSQCSESLRYDRVIELARQMEGSACRVGWVKLCSVFLQMQILARDLKVLMEQPAQFLQMLSHSAAAHLLQEAVEDTGDKSMVAPLDAAPEALCCTSPLAEYVSAVIKTELLYCCAAAEQLLARDPPPQSNSPLNRPLEILSPTTTFLGSVVPLSRRSMAIRNRVLATE